MNDKLHSYKTTTRKQSGKCGVKQDVKSYYKTNA